MSPQYFYIVIIVLSYIEVKIASNLCVLYLTAAEGFVLGLGVKLFTVAGPVIVYGVIASVIYGVIYWICKIM